MLPYVRIGGRKQKQEGDEFFSKDFCKTRSQIENYDKIN